MRAGEAFTWISANQTYSDVYFDNNKLTAIDKNTYFGVVPLYKNATAVLTSFAPVEKYIFEAPVQKSIYQIVSVNVRELNNPSSIRIPANFFTEVEKAETLVEKEKRIIKTTLLNETEKDFCFETQFPTRSKQVSQFGSYRRLPTGMQYFHTGLDLRAAVGNSVYAMADGQVALAQKFIIPGNAVIIDHGNAIYSKYYHLSEILVKPGQQIKKGDLIAKSGNTGRVEAPHLHWEVSWRGNPTDPAVFMNTMKSACL